MPDKKQHDDELVQLLARGELSDVQIAKRLGLSFSQVSRIARGEKRPDLQPKINAAMRENLKRAWKNGGRLDPSINSGSKTGTAGGEASPATPVLRRSSGQVAGKTAKTAFDRHLAVELIASGQLTLSQIAERLGVHKTTVSRIVAGRSHPELQPLIREAEKQYRDRARRIGVKWSAQIVMKQIQVGLKDNGWVGLRARQDLLDRFLAPEEERVESEVPPAERDFGPELRDLPEPLKTEVIRALGGPTADGSDDYPPRVEPPDGSREPGASSRYPIAAPPQADDAAKEQATAALEKNDVASASAEASADRQGKQEEATPLEEGCSRNKKRRRRRRREVDSFIR